MNLPRPLDGIRVLDFTRVYSGPYATLLLADMGAEVIKVEHPQWGDDSRQFGPHIEDRSSYFETLNRGKKSIAVDYRSVNGQSILRQLATQVDVVAENFRPGHMTRYGLDYNTLSTINSRLVYLSISGYGQDDPLGGYDIVAQAVSGLMSMTGIDELPIKTGPATADAITGLTAAVGLLAALYRRERIGQGDYIDVAMVDAVFACLENSLASYSINGETPKRNGNIDSILAPFDSFQVDDGWIVIGIGNDRLWKRFATLIDSTLAKDLRYQHNDERVQHYDSLRPVIAQWCLSHKSNDLLKKLHDAGIPSGKVRGIDELIHDPRLQARDMLLNLPLDNDDYLTVPGSPIHFKSTPRPQVQRAPMLGEHTNEIISLITA